MITKTVTVNGADPLMISNPLTFDVASLNKPIRASRVTFSETSDTIELDSLEIEAELNELSDSFNIQNYDKNTEIEEEDECVQNVTVIEANALESVNITKKTTTPEPLQPLKPYTPKMAVIKLNGKSNVKVRSL